MAKDILAGAQAIAHTHQYQLPTEARQAILAQSDSARIHQKIEQQRIIFMANNFGCEFGQINNKNRLK